MTRTANACPCGRPLSYEECCGRWHTGPLHLQAPDAEALMRSRYSAFVRANADYLRDSWHPDTRPERIDLDDAARTRWLGLEVKRHDVIDDDHATVEFVARWKVGGAPAVRLHEVSRFLRQDGRWYYVDGTFPKG